MTLVRVPECDTARRVFYGQWFRRHAVRIWRGSNGNLNVPYLNWNDKRWILNWNWLENDWNDNYLDVF